MALPQNELFDVFSWLPAKTVYRLKSVSKSSSKFSDETYFALKQAKNMLTKDDTCFFVQLDIVQRYNEQVELQPLPGEQLYSGLSKDVLTFLSHSTRVITSSNGLILCRTTYKNPVELFICNPVTPSWFPIPIPEHLQENPDANLKIVLDCCHRTLESDDYKVFLFEDSIDWSSSSYFVCNVYRPKDGVWKTMDRNFFTGKRRMKFNMPVNHNGALHFILDCFPSIYNKNLYFRPYIMSFNLENGMSRMLRVPREARRGSHDLSCDMSIFKWGKVSSLVPQSICLVRLRKSIFTIWVLTDYESSSWQRILKVRIKAMGLKEQDPKVTGFTVMNGDILIFSIDKKVYSYGLTGERYMRLEEICEHSCESIICFTTYSNTLRPCGTGDTTLPCQGCYTITRPGEENVVIESPLKVVPNILGGKVTQLLLFLSCICVFIVVFVVSFG